MVVLRLLAVIVSLVLAIGCTGQRAGVDQESSSETAEPRGGAPGAPDSPESEPRVPIDTDRPLDDEPDPGIQLDPVFIAADQITFDRTGGLLEFKGLEDATSPGCGNGDVIVSLDSPTRTEFLRSAHRFALTPRATLACPDGPPGAITATFPGLTISDKTQAASGPELKDWQVIQVDDGYTYKVTWMQWDPGEKKFEDRWASTPDRQLARELADAIATLSLPENIHYARSLVTIEGQTGADNTITITLSLP